MQRLSVWTALGSLRSWQAGTSAVHARSICTSPALWNTMQVCIVGSGPAGFYTAERLLKAYGAQINIDILDRLPTPFGLVRSGVAPDHPDTKNVINQFMKVAIDHRCNFLGNVTVGRDVSVATLQSMYHANLAGVLSAREFVWWYNGHPDYAKMQLDLSQISSVAICGLGNVAVDCARILLQPPDRLASTDIAQHALQQLRHSSVREVHLIGRRGPVQAAFTPKELRELLHMEGVSVHIPQDTLVVTPVDEAEMKATRLKRRVYDILQKAAQKPTNSQQQRQLHLHFLRSPVQIEDSGDGNVAGMKLEVNTLQTSADNTNQRAVGTGQYDLLKAQLVLESIGYRSYHLNGVPFDELSGTIPNRLGRVVELPGSNQVVPGLYACGWVKRGPSGIIGTNLWDAQQTVDSIIEDFAHSTVPNLHRPTNSLQMHLSKQAAVVVNFEGFSKIDQHEISTGQAAGRPREKIVDVQRMLEVAH